MHNKGRFLKFRNTSDHQQTETDLWHFGCSELLWNLLHDALLEAGSSGGCSHAGYGQAQDLPRPRSPASTGGAAGDAHTLRIQSHT